MSQQVNKPKTIKSQSAMEYLMTYGWAILIIAIVLGVLFGLGVFSSTSLVGTSCLAAPGYVCQSPTLTTSGLLTFTFGQSTSIPLYNVELACAATATSAGLPDPITAFNSIGATGTVLPPSQTGNSIVSTETLTVSSLPCYAINGNPLGTVSIGSSYSGYLWINYTTQGSSEGPGNPWITSKIITLKTKVV